MSFDDPPGRDDPVMSWVTSDRLSPVLCADDAGDAVVSMLNADVRSCPPTENDDELVNFGSSGFWFVP